MKSKNLMEIPSTTFTYTKRTYLLSIIFSLILLTIYVLWYTGSGNVIGSYDGFRTWKLQISFFNDKNFSYLSLLPKNESEIDPDMIQLLKEEDNENEPLDHFHTILRHSGSQMWHRTPNFTTTTQDKWSITVLSAYYDHRIRRIMLLLASEESSHNQKELMEYEFHCILFNASGYRQYVVPGKFRSFYTLHCDQSFENDNSTLDIPAYVYLRRNDTEPDFFDWILPVIDLRKRRDRYQSEKANDTSAVGQGPKNLAICVGALHKTQNWLMLIQFLEYYRGQGAAKVVIFHRSIDPEKLTMQILHWYKVNYANSSSSPFVVEPILWSIDANACPADYYCQNLWINYCTYENMYEFRYVGHVDLDELLYQTNRNTSLVDLLNVKRLKDPNCATFVFRGKYHVNLTSSTPDWSNLTVESMEKAVRYHAPVAIYNNVSGYMNYYYSPKSVYRPEMVETGWVHRSVHLVGFGSRDCHVSENDGFMRHYKIRQLWGEYWARDVDRQTTYSIVDLFSAEIGQPFLGQLVQNITRVCIAVKNMQINGQNRTTPIPQV